MKCSKCGAELLDGIMFCPECGEKIDVNTDIDSQKTIIAYGKDYDNKETEQNEQTAPEESTGNVTETPVQENDNNSLNENNSVENNNGSSAGQKFCPNCGTANSADTVFCANCGFSFENVNPNNAENKKAKKPINKKLIRNAGIAVAAIAVVGVGAYFVAGNVSFNKKAVTTGMSKVVYVKDNQINVYNGKKSVAIDNDFFDDDHNSGLIKSYVEIEFIDNEKQMIYPVYTDYGYDLYIRKNNQKSDEGEKIDSNIADYRLIDNTIIYRRYDGKLLKKNLKKLDDSLKFDSDASSYSISDDNKFIMWSDGSGSRYVQDLNQKKDKVKIKDVRSICYTSEDFNKIMYLNNDGDLYLLEKLDDKTKVMSDVDDIYYISDDLNKIVFKKDDTLYSYNKLKDKEKIMSDVKAVKSDAVSVSASTDGIYVYAHNKNNAYDYLVNDDLFEQDKQVKEPNISDYQKEVTKDSFWGPRTSVETDDAYYAEYEKYEKAEERNYIREMLKNQEIDLTDVYYYSFKDNSCNKVMADIIEVESDENYNGTDSYLIIKYNELENGEKYDFSKLIEKDNFNYYTDVKSYLGQHVCVLDKETKTVLDMDSDKVNGSIYSYLSNGNMYITVSGNDGNSLYVTDIKADKGKVKELTDELAQIEFVTEKNICYTAEEDKNGVCELYLDDKKISTEVVRGTISRIDNKNFMYFSEMDSDGSGTLVYYNGKENKISDDVIDYTVYGDQSIAFLYDYSTKRNEGELKLYKNGKNKEIDSDVSAILRY